jgi:hypothetical protein
MMHTFGLEAWRIQAESSLRGAERRSNPGNEGVLRSPGSRRFARDDGDGDV